MTHDRFVEFESLPDHEFFGQIGNCYLLVNLGAAQKGLEVFLFFLSFSVFAKVVKKPDGNVDIKIYQFRGLYFIVA